MGHSYRWRKGAYCLRKGRRSRAGGLYLITTVTKNRRPIFTSHDYACAAIRAFTAPALIKNTRLLSWVLMPDHGHWIIRLDDDCGLSTFVGKMKSASARNVRRLGYTETVWSTGFHDREIHRLSQLRRAIHYLQQNPIKANLSIPNHPYPYQGQNLNEW